MSDISIHAEGIGKKYIIGHKKQKSLAESANAILENFRGSKKTKEEFWALKNISFEIKQGEAVGIIGRNGAGKSTLLKILSRITEPTTGRFTMYGRVSSLLEVGTGFHPELSGRENIFLNGTILGMKRIEIKRKFDEIVDFSGIEKFIDTPVKRYSSGMYVRLAFAVAAHLEPEILIIDEVLAVGDAEFQKKCLGKMEDVTTKGGRTVLFVSHDMSSIKKLCKSCILLDNGIINTYGKTIDVVNKYQSLGASNPIKTGTKTLQLISFHIFDEQGNSINTFNTFDKVKFVLTYSIFESINSASFAICFNNSNGVRVTSLWSSFKNHFFSLEKGEAKIEILAESIQLNPDVYEIIVYAESQGVALERIDDFGKVVVGYSEEHDFIQIPTIHQGFYIEKYTINSYQIKRKTGNF